MLKYLKIVIFLLLFIFTFSSAGNTEGLDSFTPWDFDRSIQCNENVSISYTLPSVSAYFLKQCVKVFVHSVSRVDGDRCPMYPTCSSYSLQAIEKHGFFLGIVMTADRLIHESNEMDYAPLIEAGDGVHYFDPLRNNDFWWYKDKNKLDR